MKRTYKAKYTDFLGSESIEIHNDGETLETTIRGVHFSAVDLDAWEIHAQPKEHKFQLNHFEELIHYSLVITFPIDLMHWKTRVRYDGVLTLSVHVADSTGRSQYEMHYEASNGIACATQKCSDFLENTIDDIQKQLPKGWTLKTCYTCLFSDIEPSNASFTSSQCFRNIDKEIYLDIMTSEHLNPKDRFYTAQKTAPDKLWVQLLHFCPLFEMRRGIGYHSA